MSEITTQRTRFQYFRAATPERPFRFSDGQVWDDLTISYETYGELNDRRDNAILVFHALTGSQHAAGYNPDGPEGGFPKKYWDEEIHRGWWDDFIGPKKAIDTRRFFVICANMVGGCYGSTGPATEDPETGKPFGSRFPYPSMSDSVDLQVRLLDHLGIDHLLAVTGGSIGGCLTMNFAVRYPERVTAVIPIATGLRATVLAKALNFEQIYAIEEDANFRKGDFYDGNLPISGLCLARLISHKTFISLSVLQQRAQKEIRQPNDFLSGYQLQNNIESYMLHQGRKFVRRFDANSYLRIMSMWQSYDLPLETASGDVAKMFGNCRDQRWLIFSISSDVCFYPEEQEEIARALKALGIDYQHITVHSDKGHDSFLLEPDLYKPYLAYKLNEAHDLIQANFVI